MTRPTLLLLAACGFLHAADADLILHNGRILTVDSSFSIKQAVAAKNGKITAVGDSAAVLAQERGEKTRVIDLHGQTVLPGLIDSHVHPLGAGLSELRTPLPVLNSYAALRSYIAARARVTPKGQWIVVPRTFPTRLSEMRMPTRELLDVAKEHPVMFDASYVVVVNSLGLKTSSITRDTKNPPGGEIVKDARGEPNGILRNAQGLLKGVENAEQFTEGERLDALEGQLKRYVQAGLTSVIDRALTPEEIELYGKLKAQGRLPIRVVMTWRLPTNGKTEDLVRQIQAAPYRADGGDDWLRFGIFKVTLDGGMTIGTAYQRAPYGEFGEQLYGITNRDDRGQLFVPPDKLLAVLRAARDKGWALTAHSQGGGAVDALLDAFEALNREKPLAPSRSHLMHASFQTPAAIARAKRLGVLADVQPAWLYGDGDALEKVFGDEGMKYFFPLRSYVDAGVIFAGGSDHMIGHDKNRSVNPYNPFPAMWTEVSRKTSAGKVLHAEQKISREDALRSYTIWGAYLQSAERQKGSIETGKLADFVVIDRDILKCPEDQIRDIEPMMTILDGKVVSAH
ncbi:MAG: amidohydrolase [Bryobacteraceae bacterium]